MATNSLSPVLDLLSTDEALVPIVNLWRHEIVIFICGSGSCLDLRLHWLWFHHRLGCRRRRLLALLDL